MNSKESIKHVSFIFMFIGGLTAISVLLFGDSQRLWHAYLLTYVYFVLLSLGGLFFISIHYTTQAAWSVNIRRLAEACTAYLPWAAVLMLPLLYGAFSLYDWLDAEKIAADPLLAHKAAYLNFPFFLLRTAIFLGGWIFFAKKLTGFSLKQDQDGDVMWTKKSVKYSILFLLFFVFSISFFSVDFLMSLDAHWFSTIFGVYVFAGIFQSIFALLILLSIYLMKQPAYKELVTVDHLHDLGKFLLAATVFWAYIAFSQYMLIWYANLPEETTFFIPRSVGGWAAVSISLIIFKFIVPFLVLLPRWTKRLSAVMVVTASLVLFMQLVDIYWLIYPHWSVDQPRVGLLEILIFMGFTGVFIRSVFNFLWQYPPVPLKDPRGAQSTAHKVIY